MQICLGLEIREKRTLTTKGHEGTIWSVGTTPHLDWQWLHGCQQLSKGTPEMGAFSYLSEVDKISTHYFFSPGGNMGSFRKRFSKCGLQTVCIRITRKAGKNLTWESPPVPNLRMRCVPHTGDSSTNEVSIAVTSEAAVSCWASLCQRQFSKAP